MVMVCATADPVAIGVRNAVLDGTLFFFKAEDGIGDLTVTGVQTCALPIYARLAGAQRIRVRLRRCVRPRVDERTGATGREYAAPLPIERALLHVFAIAPAVEAELAHDDGPLPREVVQTGEIRLETLLRFEIHVEAQEIEESKTQVLGRRIIDVGDETVGRFSFRRTVEAPEA